MARLTANTSGLLSASIWEASILATAPAPTATTTTVTTTGIFTATFTAPNTTGKTTGSWFWFATVARDYTFTLQEATIDTACTVTVPQADLAVGWNYIRFPTPYQWTATTAGRYRFKVAAVGSNGGTIASASSLAIYMDTHDTVGTLASTDDAWVGGLIGATTTAVAIEVAGTSGVIGSGTEKSSTTNLGTGRTGGAGLTIGNGGRVWSDGTVANTLQCRGNITVGNGGEWDRPAHPTDFTVLTKTIMDCETANGNYWFSVQDGGSIDNSGAVSDTPYAEYVSGTGTSGSHFLVDRDTDWAVGMELLIEGNAYNQIEKKFIKTVYNVREFQLADTAGGAESALANAHTATSTVAMITRNNIIEQTNSTRGAFFYNSNTTRANCKFDWARWNDMSFASGTGGFALRPQSVATNFDGSSDYMVFAGGNSNRNGWTSITTAPANTDTGLVFYLPPSTNTGSGAITIGSSTGASTNQIYKDFLVFGSVSQTLILANAFNNRFENWRFAGCNSSNAAAGHAIYFINAGGNVFDDIRINSTRTQAIYSAGSLENTFNNLQSGNIAENTTTVTAVSSTFNDILFNDSTFAEATLASNYLNMLENSEIKFQNFNNVQTIHGWYTNHGSWFSNAATVRTATSLSLASTPEDNTVGSSWIFRIPATPASNVGVFGYIYRNATFSSGTLKVELFLPGTRLSATPDATYTFPTTTGEWLPFNISDYYSGTAARYARVRITGVTATAGASFFVDDLYDAGTTNKVAGLDLWDNGKPSEVMVQSDFSVIPASVWGFSDANTQASTMGKHQADLKLSNVLIKDSLS